MSITYKCKDCGGWQNARDGQAGRSVKCPDCRGLNIVPAASEDNGVFDQQFDGFPANQGSFSDDSTSSSPGRPVRTSWNARPAPPEPAASLGEKEKGGWSGGWGLLGFIALIALKFYLRMPANRPANAVRPVPFPAPIQKPAAKALMPLLKAPDPRTPLTLPSLPNLPAGTEVEPGVMLHELRLGPENAPPNRNPAFPRTHTPGSVTRLWVYMPKGKTEAKSLPCVLIAPAGSNLVEGMPLMKDDRPEHLPYVRAGFAVIAFDLEGYGATVETTANKPDSNPAQNTLHFVLGRAGLANGHVALEFATQKVPAIDPNRIYAAGHSSAGTFALIFAENEPRLKGCVAYAPAIDISARLDPRAKGLVRGYFGDTFFTRYSPRSHESELKCPLFLFAAEDDELSLEDAQACYQRLKPAGKNVTFKTVPEGGHYDSMIEEGIPLGISWLKSLDNAKKP